MERRAKKECFAPTMNFVCTHREDWHYMVCRKMDRTKDNHTE